MTKKYLIKLTPHSTFFFGGERTFEQGDTANYLVKSNDFPQQTALLGLIRYQLLRESDLFDKATNKIISNRKSEVPELIGAGSFDVEKTFDFGKIKSISPLFIARDIGEKTSYFFQTNNEYQINEKKDEIEFLEITHLGSSLQSRYNLEGYNPKYGLKNFYQCSWSDELLKADDIFQEQQQTGIRKNYQGETEKNAYYIQFFKRFKSTASSRYSFSFILELDESVDPKVLNQQKVVLGAEQCTFKMECSDNPPLLENILPDYRPSKNMDKIVLVSDAYVGNLNPIKENDFAIADTVDFRFLKTSVEGTRNYADMDRSKDQKTEKVSKSEKFSLYKKGSVFYANDTTALEQLFGNEDFKHFQKLGYNQIKVIKKSNQHGNN